MRGYWKEYRCLNQQPSYLRVPILLFGLNAGYCAAPMADGFRALEATLVSLNYTGVKSVWIPRNCPTGIGGAVCQADGTSCSIHNYGVAVDIDPFGYGNPHFEKAYGNGWNFTNCKFTEPQVRAVEAIKNVEGEVMFRWLGWPIGDTMHFEGQVPPSRTRVNWNTAGGLALGGDDDMWQYINVDESLIRHAHAQGWIKGDLNWWIDNLPQWQRGTPHPDFAVDWLGFRRGISNGIARGGARGPKGDTGVGLQGVAGKDGADGRDGRDGIDGKDGKDGTATIPAGTVLELGTSATVR